MGRDITKVKFTQEELHECYINKQMSQRQIAKHFHVDVRNVRHAMQTWNIPVRTPSERFPIPLEVRRNNGKRQAGKVRGGRTFSFDRYPFTEEELRQHYYEWRMPIGGIASKFHLSLSQVRYAVRMLEPRNQRQHLSDQDNQGLPINALDWHYNIYKKSAFLRKYVFELSKTYFEGLVTQSCYYCGVPPSRKIYDRYFNGIDRVDNKIGYIKENVRPCCSKCNLAKKGMTESEFIAWLLRAADHVKANLTVNEVQP